MPVSKEEKSDEKKCIEMPQNGQVCSLGLQYCVTGLKFLRQTWVEHSMNY
jgi:hypothetical protein